MFKRYIKVISAVLVLALTFTAFFVADVGAATKSEIEQEISRLEAESKKLEGGIKEYQGKINKQKEFYGILKAILSNL